MLSIPHFSSLFLPQMFLFYQPSVNSFFMHDLPIPGSRWESGASWGSVSVSYLSDSSSSHEIRWIHCQDDNSVSSEWSIMSRSWFGNRTQFVIKFSDWTTPCRLKLSHDFWKLHNLVACFKHYAIRTIKSCELFFTNFHFIFQSMSKNHDQLYAWHRWDKNPLKNRETVKVPLMGRALEGIRRGNMMVTHLLMGFGKDHNPKNWWIFTPEEVSQKLYQTVGYCTTISHLFDEDVLLNVLCSCLHIFTVHVKLSLNVLLVPLKQQHVALLSNANISLMLNCLYVYLVGACKPAIDSTLLFPLWEFW